MGTIKDEVLNYEPTQLKNISELDKVSVELEVRDGSFIDKDGKEVKYKYVELNGLRYKIPFSVYRDLKAILHENPKLMYFKVKRTGTTKTDTRYTVIPLG